MLEVVMHSFRVVGVVSRSDRTEALKLASQLARHLRGMGVSLLLEPRLADYMGMRGLSTPVGDMRCDLVLVVGGDGTILKTCLQLPKPEPPILPINMGSRGFLAEVPPEKASEALERCMRGDYWVERCWKLASRLGGERLPDALNELFISSEARAKLTHLEISKDGRKIAEYKADGLIVATQTGSTGYSLSAGGSILDPEVEAFILTPACPLTPYRPLVLPTKSRIEVRINRPERAIVVVDGNYTRAAGRGSVLSIWRSEHETRFIRFNGDFYRRLRDRALFTGGF